MYVAILHEGSRESQINAVEYKSRFGTSGGHGIWLTCPECGQPVVTRAMANGSYVSPYFKHESDDPIAQECPNYRYGGDSYGGYGSGLTAFDGTADLSLSVGNDDDENDFGPATLSEAVDMFLEIDGGTPSFNLLIGFPALRPWAIAYLEIADAFIASGTSEYNVCRSTFSDYSILYYTVDGPSFGTGIELRGPSWMRDISLPNIKHTLNGCMLFECLGWEPRVKRLDAESIDLYQSNQFTLVYSTATGMYAAIAIVIGSTQFKVVGTLNNSQNGENEIKVARFITTNRDLLKTLFP